MDLSQRIAKLSPAQRAQLEMRLRERQDAPKPRLDRIEKRPTTEPCPLSFAQERLWFLEQLEGASATYNIYSATRFRGVLHVQCLEQALTEILCRHEPLRTTFPVLAPDQPPMQQISGPSEFRLEVVDLLSHPEAQSESAVRQLVNEFVRQPMYLADGPLFRARLLRLAPDDHVLVVIMHHIISDGWSLEVFFRELYTLYADFLSGRKPSLPPLKIQFADFARWQREHLQGEELKRHLDYWKKRLAGESPLLELPADFPRPAAQSYRGSDCERRIDAGLAERIRRMSRETEATLFMTLLAAFTTLLHRYSGQPSIHVGSPATNRNRIELEPLIGFFVNMLVLRIDFSGDPTGRELIQQVRQVTLEALSHQELPFEKLVRELQPERSLSHPPLFQAALMFEQGGQQFPQLPGLAAEPIPVNTATAKFDLTLFVSERPEGLSFGLEYAKDLFTAETAERILTNLECLLESMVANPNLRVSQLNLLTSAEKQQLLIGWNQSAAEHPREKTVGALFEEQAQRSPDSIAVEIEGERLSYHELNNRAEVLAVELRQKGVTVETLVGLHVDRSLDMIVGVLGIWKAGGAYVPLDPSFPPDRLALMMEDAAMPVVVTQTKLLRILPETKAIKVCLDTDEFRGQRTQPRSGESTKSGPENLAYVLFTSGSTGRPKGVQIPHRAVVNFLESMRRKPGLRTEDTLLAVTTLSFDIAGLELFLPLTTGAKVVIAPREIAVDGMQLKELIRRSGTTVMQATPATWRLLIEAGWDGDRRLKILCGGEALDQNLALRLLPRCGQLWNMYGPTETTIWSTCSQILETDPVITIGRPIDNTEIYLLDAHCRPVPVGVAGELLIGGDGLARGYLNRPELTAEKFIAHPFKPGARLYRTGDLARYRQDGNIECLGRIDHQVKIRGFRIELGEIEAVLAQHPGVAQAVVAAREDVPGDKRLVAYLVARLGPTPSVEELRQHLRQQLPEYMIPSVFVVLEHLPLTPNGKVNRKALPRPEAGRVGDQTQAPPVTDTEKRLVEIWQKLLDAPGISRNDNFFDLGGHSLLAVSLFARIEQVFGRRLPLATLFNSPTLGQLAATLERNTDPASGWNSLVTIHPTGSAPPLFFVHGAAGNVLLYRDLSRHLGEDIPFYGLQACGLDGSTEYLTRIEEMAAAYIREIRRIQPKGPYCVGGYCMGGTVAFEIAQQFHREGATVDFLALLDTYNFAEMAVSNSLSTRLSFRTQRIRFHASNLLRLTPTEVRSYLSTKLQAEKDSKLQNVSVWIGNLIRRLFGRNEDHRRRVSLQEVNDHAGGAYRPKAYPGRVTVFRPRRNYTFFPDPQMGWGALALGGVEVVELPVNPHAMLVEPYVKFLAAGLKARLPRSDSHRQTVTHAHSAVHAPQSDDLPIEGVGGIIIGGDFQGLGIARSLGRHGVPVCVIDDEWSISRYSRYTTHAVRVKDLLDERKTIETIMEIGRRLNLKGWVLYPTRDETVAALSRHKKELSEWFRVPTPDWSSVKWAWDKRNTYRRAQELGIASPRTWFPQSIEDLGKIDADFPLVIKPAIKEHFIYTTKVKAWRADNREELISRFEEASGFVPAGELMVQDLIPGGSEQLFGFCSFFKEGRSLGTMVTRYRRQHPPQFGRSCTFVESVELPVLEGISQRFLRAIDYYGLVELEFKLDPRDGVYRLLDANARTWGYHTLGTAAGVDFPYMQFADQLGKPVTPARAHSGKTWVRLVTDLPGGLLGVMRRQSNFWTYLRSVTHASTESVFSFDDPLPSVAEAALLPYLIYKRGY